MKGLSAWVSFGLGVLTWLGVVLWIVVVGGAAETADLGVCVLVLCIGSAVACILSGVHAYDAAKRSNSKVFRWFSVAGLLLGVGFLAFLALLSCAGVLLTVFGLVVLAFDPAWLVP